MASKEFTNLRTFTDQTADVTLKQGLGNVLSLRCDHRRIGQSRPRSQYSGPGAVSENAKNQLTAPMPRGGTHAHILGQSGRTLKSSAIALSCHVRIGMSSPGVRTASKRSTRQILCSKARWGQRRTLSEARPPTGIRLPDRRIPYSDSVPSMIAFEVVPPGYPPHHVTAGTAVQAARASHPEEALDRKG